MDLRSIFIWQSYYSQRKIKIEPTIKLNHNIYMSFPSRLPFGWAMRAFTSGLKGGESWSPCCCYGKSQPYSACLLTWTEKMPKLKQHTVFGIVNIAMVIRMQQFLEIRFIITGHLIGSGKNSKITREFSGIHVLCRKICWLRGKHAGFAEI